MSRTGLARRDPDVPAFDASALAPDAREALADLLLSLADDEFVVGFLDSEWTGIAPMLEEDVAFSSLAQDEIGHARVFYDILAALTGRDADDIAFGRAADEYRHCRLLDHPRGDWAFSLARRYLYDTADAIRLAALRDSSFLPLSEVVAKIRREETYHLMHLDAWIRRLAAGGPEPRQRLEAALEKLWPETLSVFAPLAREETLLRNGVLGQPMAALAARQWGQLRAALGTLGIALPDAQPSAEGGRDRVGAPEGFAWLWEQFTSVRRLDPEATW